MAICLASGVKAQFYDSADDIYYYVEEYYEHDEYKTTSFTTGYYTGRTLKEKPEENEAHVLIFNFDGTKAALLAGWGGTKVRHVKTALTNSPSYYDDKIETTEYNVNFISSSSLGTVYKYSNFTYTFSADRNTLKNVVSFSDGSHPTTTVFKRVDKSFFKVGRSRTPSSTLHE